MNLNVLTFFPARNVRARPVALLRRYSKMKSNIDLTEQESILRELLLDVADYIARQTGYNRPDLRFTGGWVRDKLLGQSSKDIDVGISSTTGFEFANFLKSFMDDSTQSKRYGADVVGHIAKIKANPEQSKHLETANARVFGLDVDFVNLRRESYAVDSRNPIMEFGTPKEDALRRDSTVNSLFFNLTTCQIEDLTGHGLEDMEKRIIRTPLDPFQTFDDDPLRVLRCIRFASKLDFSIDAEAKACMGNEQIKDALQRKIRRERIGVEVEKMLRGPRPRLALSFIDTLGLYGTIFSDPTVIDHVQPDTESWSRAYNLLHEIVSAHNPSRTTAISSILKLDPHSSQDICFNAWFLCAMAPWARINVLPSKVNPSKLPTPTPVAIVREGLKFDNKSMTLFKDAMFHLDDIIASKDVFIDSTRPQSATNRKHGTPSRESLGLSIRRWGSRWRSSVLLALLVQSMEAGNEDDLSGLLHHYSIWLLNLHGLGLLDAYSLRPLIDGKQLMEITGRSSGPWLASALDTVIKWQLRNPQESDPRGAIAEVLGNLASKK